MAYPFVPAFYDYGPRNVTIKPLAINIHMAEGGGTVGYLAKANPNHVSVHYVVEYGGRIVQMLHESHGNGSINPRDIRTTDDPPYTFRGEVIRYGVTAARKALGEWWDDPNRATIGIEIEGFAKDGPNAVQAAALLRLVNDIRTRQPGAPLTAHRDFADYKACPGHRIDWGALGGHGEAEMKQPTITNLTPLMIDIAKGATYYAVDAETPAGTNALERIGVRSDFGSYTKRSWVFDPDGTGDDKKRSLYWVVPTATAPIPAPEPPDPVPSPAPTVLTGDDGSEYRRV